MSYWNETEMHLDVRGKLHENVVQLYTEGVPTKRFFCIYTFSSKLYNTCYIDILLYFLITIQLCKCTGRGPRGAKDTDYPNGNLAGGIKNE